MFDFEIHAKNARKKNKNIHADAKKAENNFVNAGSVYNTQYVLLIRHIF